MPRMYRSHSADARKNVGSIKGEICRDAKLKWYYRWHETGALGEQSESPPGTVRQWPRSFRFLGAALGLQFFLVATFPAMNRVDAIMRVKCAPIAPGPCWPGILTS